VFEVAKGSFVGEYKCLEDRIVRRKPSRTIR